MAKPIPDIDLRDISKNDELKPLDNRDNYESVIDCTINRINKKKSGRDLVLGTLSGWLCGFGSYKLGKIAAFGIGGSIILLHFATDLGYIHINWDRIKEALNHSQELVEYVVQFVKKNSCFSVGFVGGFFFGVAYEPNAATPTSATEEDTNIAKKQLPIEPIPIKPVETYKHSEEPIQPSYAQSKPMSHSPKISPSSIPNPNPSVISTKQSDPSYVSIGGYPFSIPGYSAFQPVSHAVVTQSSSSSNQPAASSADIVKSQSDYPPTIPAGTTPTSVASLPAFSISSTSQGSILPSMQSMLSMPLTSTFSSAPPITTAASIGSMPQITSVLSMPPVSTMASKPPLPSSMPQSKPVESRQSIISVEQSSSPKPRIQSTTPLEHSLSTNCLMPSESSIQSMPSSIQMMSKSKSSIQRVSSEQSHVISDVLMQQMTHEHSMSTMVTMPSSTQQTMSGIQQSTVSELPTMQRTSLQHTISSNPNMPSEILLEHSASLNLSTQQVPITTTLTVKLEPMQRTTTMQSTLHFLQSVPSRESQGMPSDMMTSDSMQQVSAEHSTPSMSPNKLSQETVQQMPLETSTSTMPTIPSEESMHRTMTFIPNMPTDSPIQRMHLDYYMPTLPMMPPELLIRRMQLLQYMQSMQTITTEPTISLMPSMPAYALSLPHSQSTTLSEATSLERSMPVISTDQAVLHRQSTISTSSLPSQSIASTRPMLETQSNPLMPIITPVLPCTLPISSMSKSMTLIPVESMQLSSEQSVASTEKIQSIQTSTSMTVDSPIMSTPLMPIISHTIATSPDISMANKSDQSLPLVHSIIVPDQSLSSTQRMQMVLMMPAAQNTTTNSFSLPIPNILTTTSSEPSRDRPLLVEAVPSITNKLSEPNKTLTTQVPFVQSMSYDPAMSSESSLHVKPLEPTDAISSIEPSPPVTIVSSGALAQNARLVPSIMSSNISLTSMPHVQVQPLFSMSAMQPSTLTMSSMPSETSMKSIPYTQTSVSSIPTIQQMHFVRPSQSMTKTEIDKSMLHTHTTISSESSLHQKVITQPIQSLSIKPSKLSMASTPHMQTSMLRMKLAQPMQSITTISSAPYLASIQQQQSTPQLSTMSSDPSMGSMQRTPLVRHMPLMSIMPSESNQIISNEFIPPVSLVQSMSDMTLASSINPMQTISSIDSVPSVSDSLQIMTSGQSMNAIHSEITARHTPPASPTPSLRLDEIEEELPVIDEHCLATSQMQYNTDFEEHFKIEHCSTAAKPEDVESTISMVAVSQGSHGASVEVPLQTKTKKTRRKPIERFSLKTSIPISKIDMKCVSNRPDIAFQNPLPKKLRFNASKVTTGPRAENQIQRSVLTRGAGMVSDDDEYRSMVPSPHANLTTLISAAEAINEKDSQFWRTEPKVDLTMEENPIESKLHAASAYTEASKTGFQTSSPDKSFSDHKKQIVFIQNKNCTNKKMILTIKQQNPQVLLKRRNLQPTRFSSQLKKRKEDSVTITEHIPSKVVALKRLHQGDCDEDDFENLITENQIYGNKIVVKEKIQGTQGRDLKLKNNKTKKSIQSETKNIVKPPNFVYLSNVKCTNNVMHKNNIKTTTNKSSKIILNENKVTETNNTLSKSNDSIIKSIKHQNAPITKENPVNSSNIVLPMSPNKQRVVTDPKLFQQSPKIADSSNTRNEPGAESKLMGQNLNEVIPKPIEQNKGKNKVLLNPCHLAETRLQPKVVITDIMLNTTQAEEEVSSMDIYEKRKKLRRKKYLSNRDAKDIQKSETKKPLSNGRYIITPEKIKAEIYKEFASTRLQIGDKGDTESDYEENELKEYESIIKSFGPTITAESGKTEFLSNFMLGSQETCKELLWNKRERIIQKDKIASAYIAAGRLDQLINEEIAKEIPTSPTLTISPPISYKDLNDNGSGFRIKQMFLSQLNLKFVMPQHSAGYETTWQEILKERKRRDAPNQSSHVFKQPRRLAGKVEINTNCELQMLTEIKNCVSENNNLIKKRLDLSCQNEGDSIKTLAEKNFSELNRLSLMADRSVKHFSGQDTTKRDLNPGFDSENIQNPAPKLDPPLNYPSINIPSISKIISLKTSLEPSTVTSTQATSMDEPQNSAAGVDEMFSEANIDKTKDIECQTEKAPWPGVGEMLRIYKDFEKERKEEMTELRRRNTALKVEGAHITRNASRQSDRARALLAERRNLCLEEGAVKQSVQRLFNAVDVVRNYF